MKTSELEAECQMIHLPAIAEKDTFYDFIIRIPRKIFWAIWRRIEYIYAAILLFVKRPNQSPTEANHEMIKAGDLVQVRSKNDIKATLNAWNEYKGCAFIDDMWDYCGSTQRVFKKVQNFVDERDYKMKRVKGIYLLENVFCQGTKVMGRCDRSCFFFWREEWLEKL